MAKKKNLEVRQKPMWFYHGITYACELSSNKMLLELSIPVQNSVVVSLIWSSV